MSIVKAIFNIGIDVVSPCGYAYAINGGMIMATIKTAVSLDKKLFDQINKMAQILNIPRIRLFSLAAKEFIQKYQKRFAD